MSRPTFGIQTAVQAIPPPPVFVGILVDCDTKDLIISATGLRMSYRLTEGGAALNGEVPVIFSTNGLGEFSIEAIFATAGVEYIVYMTDEEPKTITIVNVMTAVAAA